MGKKHGHGDGHDEDKKSKHKNKHGLTEQQVEALEELAAAQGMSLSELIRRAVDDLLAKGPKLA